MDIFNLFLNEDKTRKSPLAVYVFMVGLVYCAVFGVLFALLTDPLHDLINTGNERVSTLIHSLIISLIGTLICCLFYLLPNKKIAMGGFGFLALLLVIGFVISFFLEEGQRYIIQQLLMLYAAGPTLVGNVVGLVAYRVLIEHTRNNTEASERKQ